MAKRDDEKARQERNASIRALIEQARKGEPAPAPRTPRDLADKAAEEAAEEAGDRQSSD